MSMTDNGKMIKLMVTEYIAIWMVQNMQDIGLKTSNTAKDWKPGLMVLNIMDNTYKVKSMVRASSPGPMEVPIMENLLKIIFDDTFF